MCVCVCVCVWHPCFCIRQTDHDINSALRFSIDLFVCPYFNMCTCVHFSQKHVSVPTPLSPQCRFACMFVCTPVSVCVCAID